MATYYGARYFRDASNNAEQAIPLCAPGSIKVWDDYATFSAAFTTSDSLKAIRMPAGHIPVMIHLASDGDLDTGANTLAVNIGTTADADLMAAGLVIGDANRVFLVPSNNGATTGNPALLSTAAPTADYDILITPTVSATTSSTGTLRYRLFYTSAVTAAAVDPTNSPTAVAGTQ